jgi:hypothetical protein
MKLHRQALINTAKSLGNILAYVSVLIAVFALAMFQPLIAISLLAIGLLGLGVWGIYKHELERLQAQERSDDRKNYIDTSSMVTQVLDNVRKRRQQSQSQPKE